MRILVLSDSHGRPDLVKKAILSEPEAGMIFFLGDGVRDVEYNVNAIGDRECICVKGNNDPGSDLPLTRTVLAGGKRFFLCHGHSFYVKQSPDDMKLYAKEHGIDVFLYGHTHHAYTHYEDGIHYFNPGAVMNFGYGVVDVIAESVICIAKKLR